MIIDAHNHPDWHGHNFNDFLKNMEKYNIDKTWLLSAEIPKNEYNPHGNSVHPISNKNIPFELCRSYKEKAPDKFVLGYAPDPRKPESIDRLQAAIEIYGVRIYGELKLRMCYDNPDALRMFRFCGEKGLPVTVHIDYEFDTGSTYPRPNYWFGGGIEAFERAVKACPETTFLGHGPGFWAHISNDDQYNRSSYPEGKVIPGGKVPKMLRKYPNLYCDLSAGSGHNALNRDHNYACKFIKEFQDRLLHARDYFDNRQLQLLRKLDIDDNIKEKIFSGNALKLVPLA